jgi:hypothetical protein
MSSRPAGGHPPINYRRRATAWAERARTAVSEEIAPQPLKGSTLYRLVTGADRECVAMSTVEISDLGDPMARLLRQNIFPLTANALLERLDAAATVPRQAAFLISEAGQLSAEQAPSLQRDARLAIIRGRSSEADLAISTGVALDSESEFLQVASWDDEAGQFNFYMRLSGTWVWAGNSYHALTPPSRGNGCFDSHVNGSLVMKELKQPWMNWQSMNATIQLADDDPLRNTSLYHSLSGAEDLENIVRAGVRRWTAARLKRAVSGDGRVMNAEWFLRQLCTTTTVNLASTTTASATAAQNPRAPLALPLGFWFNSDVLLNPPLEVPADFDIPVVSGRSYAGSLVKYDFALVQDDVRLAGDTFFAFAVPEASYEDNDVVNQMVTSGLLTAHFAASILMVDFANPIFSTARAKLLDYMKIDSATIDPARGGLSQQVADAITQAAERKPSGSPEAEFTANWGLAESDWRTAFAGRIESYIASVARRLTTQEGFDDYVRLAESRRREFKRMRLHEFSLSLPVTNILATEPLLHMQPDGTVEPKPTISSTAS